ncbi:hypothetical protein AB9F46_17205 [Rhizobium leguminosarum]|uniref:hypothetical protein n=1 Tax=Rhizobium leguminosarum TaxID=384 RepID=UPI003F97E746
MRLRIEKAEQPEIYPMAIEKSSKSNDERGGSEYIFDKIRSSIEDLKRRAPERRGPYYISDEDLADQFSIRS